jgi:hypothetical protein
MARHPDALGLAYAMWTDEWWYPDSSIDVSPPMLTSRSSTIPRDSQAMVVGKQALLACLKYKQKPPPLTDIWETAIEASEDEDEITQKRNLIGTVVKASDGSFQLFSDHHSHIGSNHKGCCGRSFDLLPKVKVKRKRKVTVRRPKFVSFKWKTTVVQAKIKHEEIKEKARKTRICSKTYSTYAIQHKFREQYVSLRIGVKPDKNESSKAKPFPVLVQKMKKSTPKQKVRKSREGPEEYIDLSKIVMRVAPRINLSDFEADQSSYEEDQGGEVGGEPGAEAEKKKVKKKAKKKVYENTWYEELIDLKHKNDQGTKGSRRGSVLLQGSRKGSKTNNGDTAKDTEKETEMLAQSCKTIFFEKKGGKKTKGKKSKKAAEAEAEAAKKAAANDARHHEAKKHRHKKKKSKVLQTKAEEDSEVMSTRELFPYLGKENVERVIIEICEANPKWSSIIEYHTRIMAFGIHLELDTLLRGMMLPTDYNEVIRQSIEALVPRQRSRLPSMVVKQRFGVPSNKLK